MGVRYISGGNVTLHPAVAPLRYDNGNEFTATERNATHF